MSTGKTILLVEDNPSILMLMERSLAPDGYTILTAPDGESALELAMEPGRRVDVLVTDLVLPRLGGHELAARLIERDPSLRVVLISGYAGEEAARLGLDTSRYAFLEKPFFPATFRSTVRDVLAEPDPEREDS